MSIFDQALFLNCSTIKGSVTLKKCTFDSFEILYSGSCFPSSPGGGVLLVEALLFENRRGPIMAQIFSLNMLVQAEGRERPPSEYSLLLKRSGFLNVQVCRTGKSYDAILATR